MKVLVKPLLLLSSALLIIGTMFVVASNGYYLHTEWLENKVSKSVYMIAINNVAGTAFALNTKDGVVIVTNDHICSTSETGKAYLRQKYRAHFLTKIIYRSPTTDLCLLAAPVDAVGLNLATSTFPGDQVRAIGHPAGMALTVSNIGQIIEETSTTASDEASFRGPEVSSMKCDTNHPKYIYKDIPYAGSVCIITIPKVFFTNVMVQKGNSGSPLVNFYGEVVGVVAAVDKYGWAWAVALDDVYRILFVESKGKITQ